MYSVRRTAEAVCTLEMKFESSRCQLMEAVNRWVLERYWPAESETPRHRNIDDRAGEQEHDQLDRAAFHVSSLAGVAGFRGAAAPCISMPSTVWRSAYRRIRCRRRFRPPIRARRAQAALDAPPATELVDI